MQQEPEELVKLVKFFVKVLKQRLKQKKTLPYWKYWKKTERLQIFLSEAEEIAEEGGGVVAEETVAELIAGGAGTIIEAVSEASGRRSHYT